jgi:hypothetical protein
VTITREQCIFIVRKLLTGVNAKMNGVSDDILIVNEHLVFEEIFANYTMDPWATHAKL